MYPLQVLTELTEGAKLPEKNYKSDFCYDVYAVSEIEHHPGVYKYGLGLKFDIQIDEEFLKEFDVCIDFRPRSSICTTGMVLSNSIGTIDLKYRGEVSAVFYHVIRSLPRYKVGDKIGQIKISVAPKAEFLKVDKIDQNTDRGTKGYGSSGNK